MFESSVGNQDQISAMDIILDKIKHLSKENDLELDYYKPNRIIRL